MNMNTYALKTLVAALGLALGAYSAPAADITWALNGSGNWSMATNWSPSLVPGPADNVYITPTNKHTVTLDVSTSVASLTLAGAAVLDSYGSFNSVTVNGAFVWSGGTIQGAQVIANGASTLNGVGHDAMTFSLGGMLVNAGTMIWSGNGTNLNVGSGTITNLPSHTLTLAGDVCADYGNSGNLGNAGTITKTAGDGTTILKPPFINTGTVQVQSGTLDLTDGNAAGGTFAVSSGATLQMTGVNSVTSASSVTGAGTFLLSAGILSCTSNLTVNCPFTWTTGTIESAGGVTLNGPSSLSGIGQNAMNLILGGVLINASQMTWSGSGTNLLLDSGTLTNLAAGTISIAADVSATAGGTIGNAGLLLKTNAPGTTRFSAAFVNTGTLDVQSGTVSLMGNNTLTGGTLSFGISGPTNYGKINLSSPALFKGSLGVNLNGIYWPTVGSSFNLLTYPSETGVLFTNTALPAFITWQTNYNSTVFTLTAGARQTNTAPTNIALSLAGDTNLNLAWPGDHTGWELEAQTNSTQVGLGTNWVIVQGSGSTNEITLPIGVANGAVFFRLTLP